VIVLFFSSLCFSFVGGVLNRLTGAFFKLISSEKWDYKQKKKMQKK
jgi:hypothetical protein